MKKIVVLLVAVALITSFMTAAVAAETMKGTIRGIDKQKGTITFCPEGTTDKMPLDVGKSVDLTNIDTDMKVQINVETKDGKKTVKDIKVIEKKHKVIEGC
jgi:Cu/Ag efflux protein CusF